MTGIALYQSAFSNRVGRVNDFATGKSGTTRWFVTRHESPGYRITMTLTYDVSETQWLASDGDVLMFTASGTRTQETAVYLDEFVDGRAEFATPVTGSGTYFMDILDPDHVTVGGCPGGECDTCGGDWTWTGTGTTVWDLDDHDAQTLIVVTAPFGANVDYDNPGCPESLDVGLFLNNYPVEVYLDIQGTQTVDIPLEDALPCEVYEHSGSRCEGTATWEISVQTIGPRPPEGAAH